MIRKQYRACIKPDMQQEEVLHNKLEEDSITIQQLIQDGQLLTVAMYRHETMLFLYYEAEEELAPQEVFPVLSEGLEEWPTKEGKTTWAYMYPIFYHSEAKEPVEWVRTEKKVRRGRIAYLLPEKLYSYVYYHKALVDEGLIEGDQYQYISLHEDILFSYFEEPKKFTHIREEVKEESTVIKEWLAVDPESHFDHNLSGEENFLFIEEVFSMGQEDVLEFD